MSNKNKAFPAKCYAEAVLEPVFNIVKRCFYREIMMVNYAHTAMLAHEGIITKAEASQIFRGLKTLEASLDPLTLEYDSGFEDLFFYIEGKLIDTIGIDTAGKMHTGRSRNDLGITVFKMKLKEKLRSLLHGVLALTEVFLDAAEAHKKSTIVAYTHGQPAQPTTFGHFLGGLVEILQRDADRLLQAYQTVDLCSMGAAAITTTGFPINRSLMAELLGFRGVQENSYGCIAASDYLLESYSAVRVLFINLGRFLQEISFWTTFEVSQLYVSDGFVQTSSIMPQKRNPVPIEHMRYLSSLIVGYCDAVVQALHNTPFADVNDSDEIVQQAGFQAFEIGGRVLKLLGGFVSGLEVNAAKVKDNIDRSYITATELADSLVRAEGISFRTAHEITGRLVNELAAKNIPMSQITRDMLVRVFQLVVKKDPSLTEAEVRRFVSPDYFLLVRERFGGPGIRAFSESLIRYRNRLSSHREKLSKLAAVEADARVRLENLVAEYTMT